jgi:hypothetical protein
MKWLIAAVASAILFCPALASEAIFSAGGTFNTLKGYVGLPATTWNPASNSVHPSGLPFTVPSGKTLLVTDIFVETDPLPPYPFLMVLAGEIDGHANTLRTIHLRGPEASYEAFSTPLPIQSGTTLNVLFQNSMPAGQSVNWSITGRLVDEIEVVASSGNAGHAPPNAIPYPFPKLFLLTDPSPARVSFEQDAEPRRIKADIGRADFVAHVDTGDMARIISRTDDGILELDRPSDFLMSGDLLPVWIADYGTNANHIRDIEAPACEDIESVLLLGPFVGKFPITSCQPGSIVIETAAHIEPGQRLQYLPRPEVDGTTN